MKRKSIIALVFCMLLVAFGAYADNEAFVGGIGGEFDDTENGVLEFVIDASDIKITLTDPPQEEHGNHTPMPMGKQVLGDPFEGLMRTTLDEIIAKYDLGEEEAKSSAQNITRSSSPVEVPGIPYITPSLSIASAYNGKNKSVQTNMTEQGQIHWYKMVVDGSDAGRDFSFVLTNIPSNCDYDLYISTNGVDFSGLPASGNSPEQFGLTLPMGTYYVIVVADVHRASTNSCYTVYAGRRWWSKILNIDIPHEYWDANGSIRSVNPIRIGYELRGDGKWYLISSARWTYNLDGVPYETIPYGATVHHHNGPAHEAASGSRLRDSSYFGGLGGGSWGTLQRLGAYHFTRPTNSAHASSMSGMYRYNGDTRINDDTANLISRTKVFPVRQQYVLEVGFDGTQPSTMFEAFYYISRQHIWIEYEANYVNVVHLFGNAYGIPCMSK